MNISRALILMAGIVCSGALLGVIVSFTHMDSNLLYATAGAVLGLSAGMGTPWMLAKK